MFPLKTLILAAILAVAFGSNVIACPAHNHMQTATAPAADEAVTTATAASTKAAPETTADAQPAEVAAAEKPVTPAAN